MDGSFLQVVLHFYAVCSFGKPRNASNFVDCNCLCCLKCLDLLADFFFFDFLCNNLIIDSLWSIFSVISSFASPVILKGFSVLCTFVSITEWYPFKLKMNSNLSFSVLRTRNWFSEISRKFDKICNFQN